MAGLYVPGRCWEVEPTAREPRCPKVLKVTRATTGNEIRAYSAYAMAIYGNAFYDIDKDAFSVAP